MSKSSMELFRCPTCGKLVALEPGVERVCIKCGYEFARSVAITPRVEGQRVARADGQMVQRDIATRETSKDRITPVDPAARNPTAAGESKVSTSSEHSEDSVSEIKPRRNTKKRSSPYFGPLVHLGGWTAVVMLIVIGVKLRTDRVDSEVAGGEKGSARVGVAMEEEIQRFLARELPSVRGTLLEYLDESNWAGRAQFVSNAADIAPKMQRHYRGSGMWRVSPGSIVMPVSANVITVPDRNPMIEMLFRVEPPRRAPGRESGRNAADESYVREVVFVRESNRWKIDWESLVRYSPQSWPLFYSGAEGSDQSGEFRLFVKLITTRLEEGAPVMVLKFFQPREEAEEMWSQDSPPVVVRKDSASGKRLLKILDRDASGSLPGEPRLWHRDPEDVRRVRVRLSWKMGEDEQRYLAVDKVLAANWFSSAYAGELLPTPFSGASESSENEVIMDRTGDTAE